MQRETQFLNMTNEAKGQLVKAVIASLRWYALLPDKRIGDDLQAVVLTDLLNDLQEVNA